MADSKELAIINQKNLIDDLETKLANNTQAHPHDKISQRMQIIKERIKLGQLTTSNHK
jgi:hypothetical protein